MNETAKREAVKREAAAAPPPPEPQPTNPTPVDVVEQLERLGRLRETGALTEDEFQAQKATLLGRVTRCHLTWHVTEWSSSSAEREAIPVRAAAPYLKMKTMPAPAPRWCSLARSWRVA